MFACFDQPDLKATFDVVVTAPGALAGDLQRATTVAHRDGEVTVQTPSPPPRR